MALLEFDFSLPAVANQFENPFHQAHVPQQVEDPVIRSFRRKGDQFRDFPADAMSCWSQSIQRLGHALISFY
jgi:hypothetical protein